MTVVRACCRRRRFAVEEVGDCAGARGCSGAMAERDRVAGGPVMPGERSRRSELARSATELLSVTGEDDYSGGARIER